MTLFEARLILEIERDALRLKKAKHPDTIEKRKWDVERKSARLVAYRDWLEWLPMNGLADL